MARSAVGQWACVRRLVDALALAEGAIDFAEDDDLVQGFNAGIIADLTKVRDEIDGQIVAARRGEKLRQGLVVAIAGPPKRRQVPHSSMSWQAGRSRSFQPHAGTTRDALEVDLELQGQAVRLVDTAGLRETGDPIEREGIARARVRVADADLVLWLDDGSAAWPASKPDHAQVWHVATKADRPHPRIDDADFVISAKTGGGIDRLLDALSAHAADSLSGGRKRDRDTCPPLRRARRG